MLNEIGSQVVYWFGAGASAKALPVVSEMPDALRTQVSRIKCYTEGLSTNHKALKTYDEELHKLADLSIEYGSLDTYARSLYLLDDQIAELAQLKLHLSLFFYLETLILPGNTPRYALYEGYNKGYDVDPRYMGWLALLLGNGLNLNPRVKVLSWNYDCQVELALGRYCKAGGVSQMHERFRIHPAIDAAEITNENFFLTHLNGIAGQEKRENAIHAWYNSLVGFYPDQINATFNLYGDNGKMGTSLRNGFVDRMTFAWEGSETASKAIDLAESALRSADVLVVVGYSFPAFNRLIDQCLLRVFCSAGGTMRKLVIQHPTMQRDNFLNMFQLDWSGVDILFDDNRDQFHLPNELFAE